MMITLPSCYYAGALEREWWCWRFKFKIISNECVGMFVTNEKEIELKVVESLFIKYNKLIHILNI